MTAWQIIKAEMTKGKQPNTCGYEVAVETAGIIFIALKNHLKNWPEEERIFNSDIEVIKSYIKLGLCTE